MSKSPAKYTPGAKVWMDGRMVDWDKAHIHVVSHVVQYGSGVFEGIRVYGLPDGPHAFRLREHMQRLLDSAKICRMDPSYTLDELLKACHEVVAASGLDACYLRPLVYRAFGNVGVNPLGCPIGVAIASWRWGAYLGDEGLANGIDVKVSTWLRLAQNTLPAMAKSTANYLNAQLIKAEAVSEGYSEGIALNTNGTVSEGSGENIFLVKNGELITPPFSSSILSGITRRTVLTLAEELNLTVKETPIPREMLYLADELFFCGTAAEITPIRTVDRITIGSGKRGPITESLQKAFFAIVRGEVPDRHRWLTPMRVTSTATTS